MYASFFFLIHLFIPVQVPKLEFVNFFP
jgi:hypothetical protein